MSRYCDGITGTWCIYANYPNIIQPALPKRIRYQYPGEEFKDVVGDWFGIEEIDVYDSSSEYQLTCSAVLDDYYGRSFWYSSITNYTFLFRGIFQKIEYGFAYISPYDEQINNGELIWFAWTGYQGMYARVIYKDSDEIPGWIVSNPGYNPSWNHNEGLKRAYPFQNIVITRSDNQPIPKNYKFTIKKDGEIVKTEIRAIAPTTAYIIDSTPIICEFKNEWILVKRWDNVFPGGFLEDVPNGANPSSISLQFWNGERETGAGPVNVIDLTSEAGCPPPLVRVDCNCGCEECPENTCSVLDVERRVILCVDKITGCTVKEMEYNDKCNNYDGLVCSDTFNLDYLRRILQ